MHEVELVRQVYERITAHAGSIDEFGIDDKVDVRRFVEEIVRTTISVLKIAILPDGEVDDSTVPFPSAGHDPTLLGQMAAVVPKLAKAPATGKKKKRGRR